MEMETEILKKCTEDSNERLLKVVKGERILGDGKTEKKILKKRGKNFIKKPFHSQFMKETGNLELVKDRIVEKRNRGNANGCTR